MKKTIKKIGLTFIACSILACYMSCTGMPDSAIKNDSSFGQVDDDNDGSGNDSSFENFKPGWYVVETNDPENTYVYIMYDENMNVIKVLNIQNECSGSDFEKVKDNYTFDKIESTATLINDLKKLPPWYFKNCVTIATKTNNFYKGITTTEMTVKTALNDGNLTYTVLNNGVITIEAKYYDADGNIAKTSDIPQLYVVTSNESNNNLDFKKYFVVNQTDDIFTIKMVKDIEETTTFKIDVVDRLHGADSSADKKISFTLEAISL